MALRFEWDSEKAKTNKSKHRVSFEEAATTFADPLSTTVHDPDHSTIDEHRYLLLGLSASVASWLSATRKEAILSESLVPDRLPVEKDDAMKKADSKKKGSDEMRPEYDFSKGVRGKHAGRFAGGANIVVLDPDVAKVFDSSESVNRALRTLAEVARLSARGRRKKAG